MKHPALTKVMSAALAVLCFVMLGFGTIKIGDAVKDRDRSLQAARNLETKRENYIKLDEELKASPIDYGTISEEQTQLQEQYNSDNSKHRAELAEFSATKGGTAMGSLALDEAAYAIQVGWKQYYAGLNEFNAQLGDYAFLLDYLPSEEELAEVKGLIDRTQAESDKWGSRLDELQAKLDALREEGISELTLAELKEMLAELLEDKAELEQQESELAAAFESANAEMMLVNTVSAELQADDGISPEEFYDELNRRVYELTGKTVEEISAELELDGQKLEEVRASIEDIVRRISEADGKLENVTVTLDEVQQGLDEARKAHDEADAKLAELLELYDKMLMAIKAKAMMDGAAYALEAGQVEVDTAWYKLQQTKAGFADTEERLESEKEQLKKDHKELTEVELTVEEYDALTSRFNSARTALMLYPEIKERAAEGEDIAESAETVLLSMKESTGREYKGRMGINILCIAAGIFGILTLPEAFEKVRTYPMIYVFTILSLLCAAGAECLGMYMGWGQTYAALFGAIFALLLLTVCGKSRLPKT